MEIRIDLSRSTPPSRQIVEAVLDAIAAGRLAPDGRLPSVRVLAREVLVNPNTVARAYRDLEALGVVRGRLGKGVFVTAEGPQLASNSRSGTTLRAVVDAVRAAERAGHTPNAILSEARDALKSEPKSKSGSAKKRKGETR